MLHKNHRILGNIILLVLLLSAVVLYADNIITENVVSDYSTWEGSAMLAPYGDFPVGGFYAACNSFQRNSKVIVQNIETGASITVIITKGMDNLGVFMLLSPEAGNALGLGPGKLLRIRAEAVVSPEQKLKPTLKSGSNVDPDFNMKQMAIEELQRMGAVNGSYTTVKPEPVQNQSTPTILDSQVVPKEKAITKAPIVEPDIVTSLPVKKDPEPMPVDSKILSMPQSDAKPIIAEPPTPEIQAAQKQHAPVAVDSKVEPKEEVKTTATIVEPVISEAKPVQQTPIAMYYAPEPTITPLPDDQMIAIYELPVHAPVSYAKEQPFPFRTMLGAIGLAEPVLDESPVQEKSIVIIPEYNRIIPDEPTISIEDNELAAIVDRSLIEVVKITEEPNVIVSEKADTIKTELAIKEDEPTIAISDKPVPQEAIVTKTVAENPVETKPIAIVEKKVVETVPSQPLLQIKGKWYIQVAVFATESAARENVSKIADYTSIIEQISDARGKKLWRLSVGPLTRDESGITLLKIRALGYKDAFVKQGS